MALYNSTKKNGIYSVCECTVENMGIVDFLIYEVHNFGKGKEIWRCYEIKISNSDFHSKCKKTFVGNFNYYVMPKELYEEVKDEIPKEIGVFVPVTYVNKLKDDFKEVYCIKKPIRQELKVKREVMI
jgi:hypothetical protein